MISVHIIGDFLFSFWKFHARWHSPAMLSFTLKRQFLYVPFIQPTFFAESIILLIYGPNIIEHKTSFDRNKPKFVNFHQG